MTGPKERDTGTVAVSPPSFCTHSSGKLRVPPPLLIWTGKHFLAPISCTPVSVSHPLLQLSNNLEPKPWLLQTPQVSKRLRLLQMDAAFLLSSQDADWWCFKDTWFEISVSVTP